jgi:hypothetical protein
MRTTLEEERRALAAFVSKFDSLGLGFTTSASSSSLTSLSSSSSILSTSSSGTLVSSSSSPSLPSLSKMKPPLPSVGGAAATFAERRARASHGFGMAGTTSSHLQCRYCSWSDRGTGEADSASAMAPDEMREVEDRKSYLRAVSRVNAVRREWICKGRLGITRAKGRIQTYLI